MRSNRRMSRQPGQPRGCAWRSRSLHRPSAAIRGSASASPSACSPPQPELALRGDPIAESDSDLSAPAVPRLGLDLRLLRPLGQLWMRYIIAESPDGLILIDQQAAHARRWR